jgi:hypothetical protein
MGSTKRVKMTEEELRAAHCRNQAAYKARGSLVGGRSSAGRLPEAPPSIKWMPTQRGPSSPERRAPIVRSYMYIEYRPRMPARPLAHRDLSHVQQDGLTLGEIWSVGAKGPFNEDRGIVLAAVQQNGEALRYAAEGLKADRGIVLAAVQQNGRALESAAEPLKSDRDIVLAAVQQNGEALEDVAEPLKADKDIVLAAVQQEGWVLEYAAESLKADRDIVLAAVQQNGFALHYAAEPAPDAATPDATPERDETEVKHDIDKIDEARYAELRRHYCEAYEEHDAPTLAGTSGARLRHKRKCRARIESDSAGYKALHKMIKQLDRISNHAEVYRLLSLLYEYEVHLAPRGIARPRGAWWGSTG